MNKTYDLSDVMLDWSTVTNIDDILVVDGSTADGRDVSVAFTMGGLEDPPEAVDDRTATAKTVLELDSMFDVQSKEPLRIHK